MAQPPAEWHSVPEVMALVLRHCGGAEVDIDSAKGILRRPEPPAPTPAATADRGTIMTTTPTVETVIREKRTLVENAEDVMYELGKQRDASAYLELGNVSQSIQKRTGQTDKLSKQWYQKYKLSFDVHGRADVRVKLTASAQKRAEVRSMERERESNRQDQLSALQTVMNKLQPHSLPRALQEPELCGLLILAGKSSSPGMPAAILKRLNPTDKAGAFLQSIRPFNAALVMEALVSAHRAGGTFEDESLLTVMQAAALDMHECDKPPRHLAAPLAVVGLAVEQACRAPFVDLIGKKLNGSGSLIVPAAALRVSLEISSEETICPPCLSLSYSTFKPFAAACRALAELYGVVSSSMGEEHRASVTKAGSHGLSVRAWILRTRKSTIEHVSFPSSLESWLISLGMCKMQTNMVNMLQWDTFISICITFAM